MVHAFDAAGNFYFSDLGGDTGLHKIATDGTSSVFNAQATGINNFGEVVGYSELTAGATATHAFVYSYVYDLMLDLRTLGGTSSKAYGINDAGMVVGTSKTASEAADLPFRQKAPYPRNNPQPSKIIDPTRYLRNRR